MRKTEAEWPTNASTSSSPHLRGERTRRREDEMEEEREKRSEKLGTKKGRRRWGSGGSRKLDSSTEAAPGPHNEQKFPSVGSSPEHTCSHVRFRTRKLAEDVTIRSARAEAISRGSKSSVRFGVYVIHLPKKKETKREYTTLEKDVVGRGEAETRKRRERGERRGMAPEVMRLGGADGSQMGDGQMGRRVEIQILRGMPSRHDEDDDDAMVCRLAVVVFI